MSSNDWVDARLGDVIEFNPRESIKKGSPSKKIGMDKLNTFQRKIEGYEVTSFSGGSKFRNGDTLLARITPCLENGKTAQVTILEKDEVAFGSTEFIVLREKEGCTDNDFIFYLSLSAFIRDTAIKSMTGTSGRQRAQTDVIENTKIKLPSLEEQKAIAHVLSTLDDKIEVNNRINKTLEDMAQAIFRRWFVDFEFPNEDGEPYKSSGGEMVESELGMIPKGWRVGSLSSVANITMGQSPKGHSFNEIGNGEIFYQGRTDFTFRFPLVRLYTNEPTRFAEKNDTLLSVRAPVGDVNVAVERCCIGRGLAAISSKFGLNSYLLYLIKALKPSFDVFNGEGTVFGSINQSSLRNMKIIISNDLEIERVFNALTCEIDKMIRNKVGENRNLEKMRDTLLPKLMSGEIRVPIEES